VGLGKKAAALDKESLWAYALRSLGARALSAGEVRVKLRARAADPADIEPTLSRLKEYGYLNDERFAESYAVARRDNQGFGRFRVLQDLRKRRVAGTVAEKASASAFAGVDETAQALAFVERKFRGKDLSEEKHLASAYRRLRAAGFGSGAAIAALKRFNARAEEIEEVEETEE
jgi:regulatory protein